MPKFCFRSISWEQIDRISPNSELILGCGSVIITLFWQYWPQILRFGAMPVILCVFFGPSVCISVPLFYSIRLISLISADLDFWRDLISIDWCWIEHFYFRFYKNGCLICEMKCRNRIMTACKQAYRNLKLQTNKPLYLVGSQKKRNKFEHNDNEWPGKEIYHFWGILNFLLAWDCFTSFFAHFYQSYGPWFMPKFCFHSISWE